MSPFVFAKPSELRCEYKINPLGIDIRQPRFDWIIDYGGYNSAQNAYRIIVSLYRLNDKENSVVWDSDKVYTSESCQIIYKGDGLQSNSHYSWKVMIWNERNEPSRWSDSSSFSTGLFNPDEWVAKWISHEYEQHCNDDFVFDPEIDKWIWAPLSGIQNNFENHHFEKIFILPEIQQIHKASLLVTADEGFTLSINNNQVTESDKKIFSWTRPKYLDVKIYLVEGTNTITAKCFNTYLDKPGFILKLVIRYSTGKEICISSDGSWTARLQGNENVSDNTNAVVVASAGDKPWRIPSVKISCNPAAYFKKVFSIETNILQAYAYCSVMGLYNLSIDGNQITEDLLTPGWSDFNKRVYYNTYDITTQLKLSTEHIINIIVADGYYAGYCGWEKGRSYYGRYPALQFQIVIDYENGKREIIKSDESWLSSEGPIREADILMGEVYDATFVQLINSYKPVTVLNHIDIEHTWYNGEAVRKRFELSAVSIKMIENEKYIVDFGQNLAGFARLKLCNVGKRKITLRFAEVLNEDGTLYTENLRMARARDIYYSSGSEEEIWEPKFTYHGFRYVEITGLNEIPENTLTAIAINSLPEQTIEFITSDENVNKLYNCILWNQRSNYIDIPTDCPQRDERLGWTGDSVSFFRTAAYNYNVAAFYSKWLIDLFDAQREDGALPPIAPLPDLGVGPIHYAAAGWADAGIVVPYYLYYYYNDIRVLEKYYTNMKSYINYLENNCTDFILPEHGYGDWLSTEETSKSFLSTLYFLYDCMLMEKISLVINNHSDSLYFAELYQRIKLSAQRKFFTEEDKLIEETQTSLILALAFGLIEKEKNLEAVNLLIDNVSSANIHVATGFLGLSFLMPVLSSLGQNETAQKILLQTEFPSWMFMINNGATTLWERWDSYHPEKGIYDPLMNSFNHCSLGCVGEWFYNSLAGLSLDTPGFKCAKIKPFMTNRFEFVKLSYKTPYGFYKCEWNRSGRKYNLNITTPFNAEAEIIIPSMFVDSGEAILHKIENGNSIYKVGSGYYEFRFKK